MAGLWLSDPIPVRHQSLRRQHITLLVGYLDVDSSAAPSVSRGLVAEGVCYRRGEENKDGPENKITNDDHVLLE